MRRLLLVLAVAFLAIPAAAQFRGASLSGNAVTGQVLNHTRHDSYTFGDATGRSASRSAPTCGEAAWSPRRPASA